MYQPTTFPGQQPDEKIVVVLHRHWFVFTQHLLQVAAMILLPLVIVGLAINFTAFAIEVGTLSYTLLVMGGSLYILFLLLLLYGYWLDYALDVFIVSDKRVVDIEQSGLFHRTVAEQRLYRVQDVTYNINGVIRTFLKFGDVHIQTAGEIQHFIFEDVPNPDRVTELILRQLDSQRGEMSDQMANPQAIMANTKPVAQHQHPPSAPPAKP